MLYVGVSSWFVWGGVLVSWTVAVVFLHDVSLMVVVSFHCVFGGVLDSNSGVSS